MKSSAAGLALILAACESGIATVELALDSEPPEEIATISVFVTDLDVGFIVASATVTRERTRFPMGVPAERPLEFTLIARRTDPPLSLLGPMPAYVGRARRRISLGAERELVSIVGRPGGAVTVIVPPPDRDDIEARPRFEVEGSGDRPTRIYDLGRRAGGWLRTIALESGSTRVRLVSERSGRQWTTSALLQLRRDEDTLVQIDMPRETTEIEVVPSVFELALVESETSELVSDELAIGAPLPELVLFAEDESGLPVENLPDLRLFLRRYPIEGEPVDVDLGTIRVGEPLALEDLDLPVAPERWWIWGALRTEEPLRVERFVNFRPPGETAGPPTSLFIDFEEPNRLGRGTAMIMAALDDAGAWVRNWTATFDLSATDADIVTSEREGRITASDRGIHRVLVQRSSAPMTGETRLRGTVSSTVTDEMWTIDLPLPKIELPTETGL